MKEKYTLWYYYPGKREYQYMNIDAVSFDSAYKIVRSYLKLAKANFAMLGKENEIQRITQSLKYE